MTETDVSAEVAAWKADWKWRKAWHLAQEADCGIPDSSASPGAMMLIDVRDAVIYSVEADEDRDDIAAEAADAAPDVYTARLWAEFVDLAAWQEDPTDLGVDGSDMEQSARICLYMIAERLAARMLEDLSERESE